MSTRKVDTVFGTKECPRRVIAEEVAWADRSEPKVNIIVEGEEFVQVSTEEGLVDIRHHAVVVISKEGEHLLVLWNPDCVQPFSFSSK